MNIEKLPLPVYSTLERLARLLNAASPDTDAVSIRLTWHNKPSSWDIQVEGLKEGKEQPLTEYSQSRQGTLPLALQGVLSNLVSDIEGNLLVAETGKDLVAEQDPIASRDLARRQEQLKVCLDRYGYPLSILASKKLESVQGVTKVVVTEGDSSCVSIQVGPEHDHKGLSRAMEEIRDAYPNVSFSTQESVPTTTTGIP